MACKVLQFSSTSDRMVIETGNRTFDRQCNFLTTGNHWGTCQFSTFVRPVSETECNRFTVPAGELFDFDMKPFTDSIPAMPAHVRTAIRAMGHTVVVSEIRHHIGPHRARCKVVHGYVVTDPDNHNRLVRVFQTGSGQTSARILSTVIPYISDVDAAQAG